MCVKFPTAHNRRAGEPVSSVLPLFRLRGTLFSGQQLTGYTGIPNGTTRVIITCAMPNLRYDGHGPHTCADTVNPATFRARLAIRGQATPSGAWLRDHRHNAGGSGVAGAVREGLRSLPGLRADPVPRCRSAACHPGRVRAQFRRGAGARAQSVSRLQGPSRNLHAVQSRQGRKAERQTSRPRYSLLAHRWLLEGTHRAGHHDVFGDRAGERGRNGIRGHVFRLRSFARRDEGKNRRTPRHPQFRLLTHASSR